MVKVWDKKSDGAKLTKLFLKKGRVGLDCNRRDVDYIDVVRSKHFSFVQLKKNRSDLQEKG